MVYSSVEKRLDRELRLVQREKKEKGEQINLRVKVIKKKKNLNFSKEIFVRDYLSPQQTLF